MSSHQLFRIYQAVRQGRTQPQPTRRLSILNDY